AGADAVQIFDTWAGDLTPESFARVSLNPLQKICEGLKKRNIPVILFSRKTAQHLPALMSTSATALSVDWTVDLPALHQHTNVSLQGNFYPDVLYCSEAIIQKEVSKMLKRMEGDPGYIVNLGHGIKPDMDPRHVRAFVESVQCGKLVSAI